MVCEVEGRLDPICLIWIPFSSNIELAKIIFADGVALLIDGDADDDDDDEEEDPVVIRLPYLSNKELAKIKFADGVALLIDGDANDDDDEEDPVIVALFNGGEAVLW